MPYPVKQLLLTLAALATPLAAPADNHPLPGHDYAWSPSLGWINFHPNNQTGVLRYSQYLAGQAWSESAGWILFGNNAPANATAYSQDTGDYGVNILADQSLNGYAWCEGLGWITFGIGITDPQAIPRINPDGTVTGYAWSEAAGWINLGDGFEGIAFEATPGASGIILK